MAINNQCEIGTYIHRDGRKVRMKRGIMGGAIVFFYMRKGRQMIVTLGQLNHNWRNAHGNHALCNAEFQMEFDDDNRHNKNTR